MFQKLMKIVDREVDYLFFRRFVSWREVYRHHRARYSKDAPGVPADAPEKTVVFMADGFRRSSGLADRLRGIVALYGYCLDHGLDFRINFTHPFELQRYMMPAEHDWRIAPEQLCWNSREARAFHLMTVNNDNRRHEVAYQRKRLHKCLRGGHLRQAHVYTAFDCEDERFAELFGRLFRPAPAVKRMVGEVQRRLGGRYVSVSARFMELLGDFTEPKQARQPLAPEQRQELMERCAEAIRRVRPEGGRVLVTSDSTRFLRYCTENLDFVETIEGDVCHISVECADRDAADLKTFADFYAIAGAEKAWLLLGDGMYRSNFSRRAAQSAGRPFEIIDLREDR